MIFFTDRDLGKYVFPRELRAKGVEVRRHVDYFKDNIKDEEWIPAVAEYGWFALTHNRRIRYVPAEQDAVIRSRLGLFVLIGKAPVCELAHNFVNTLPRIIAFAGSHPVPFIAKVLRPSPISAVCEGKPGRVVLWFPRK